MIIGMAAVFASCLRILHTSRPSISGSMRSRIIKSAFCLRASSSPESPRRAVWTAKPSRSKLYLTSSTIFFSSSITRTDSLAMRSVFFLDVVLDGLTLHQINHIFADIGGVVSDSFQMPPHQNQIHGAGDGFRVLDHVSQKFAEYLVIELVHLVIAHAHVARKFRVAVHKGVEAVFHHFLSQLGHARDIDEGVPKGVLP